MFKRLKTTFQQWLSPVQTAADELQNQNNEVVNATRRSFFKRAAIGTVAVGGTAGLASAVVDSLPEPDLTHKYRKDAVAGEQDLQEWEYVEMSDQEKSDMVQTFIDSYSRQS